MFDNILFVKIGWAPLYRGEDCVGNFGEPNETNSWYERYNFKAGPNGRFYGYIPPRRPKTTIKEGWLVVFLSRRAKDGPLLPVGWFENASLQDENTPRPEYLADATFPLAPGDYKFEFNVSADAAYLVPEEERATFAEVPMAGHFRRATYLYARDTGTKHRESWRSEYAELAEQIVCRRPAPKDPPAERETVKSVMDIRESMRFFNQGAGEMPELTRSLLTQTTYWVYDQGERWFGPSKFVGFKGMTATNYHAARNGERSGATFDGQVTRKCIEGVTAKTFTSNIMLSRRLRAWAAVVYPSELVFDSVNSSKWKFITLPRFNSEDEDGKNWSCSVQDPPDGSQFRIADIEVSPPVVTTQKVGTVGLEPIGRRTDWERADAISRKLGKQGEQFVLDLEKRHLIEINRADLAARVEWVSQSQGDGLGYDIRSFQNDGAGKFYRGKDH